MLYSLFKLLQGSEIPGLRLMDYITFRSGVAFVLAMLIAIFIGKKIIDRLQLMQIGEIIRPLDLEGQKDKSDKPTMGGIIIIISIMVPCLLIGNLSNTYMLLMLVATIWLGAIGFLDDYKKFKKRNKDGIKGKYKIIGQLGIAVIVAGTMYLSPGVVSVPNIEVTDETATQVDRSADSQGADVTDTVEYTAGQEVKAPITTIPFVKNHNLNYTKLTSWMGDFAETGGWILFFIVVAFLVTATSNGANLTDGLDGLATGTSAIIGCALIIMAYLGGNIIYSSYLNIMYIPGSGELVVYMAAFIGALVGFLWYNTSPAQVFMGDTGSLMLGGVIAVFAILIRKELLLPVLCGIFYVEDLSVLLQVAFYKKTGKRIFKMAPLHHHFQKKGDGSIQAIIQKPLAPVPEQKIVTRFWIIGIILAVITFVTLKIR